MNKIDTVVYFKKTRQSKKVQKRKGWLQVCIVFNMVVPFVQYPIFTVNPYLRHFGNVMERHLWTKNPPLFF